MTLGRKVGDQRIRRRAAGWLASSLFESLRAARATSLRDSGRRAIADGERR